MSSKIVSIYSVTIAILLFSVSLSAHHGIALYNVSETLSVAGTVTDFRFENPHVLVFFDVTEDDGTVVAWSAGLTSRNRLARSDGWSIETLKIGDEISVTGLPARGGAPSLWVDQIHLNGNPLLAIPGGAG